MYNDRTTKIEEIIKKENSPKYHISSGSGAMFLPMQS